MTIDEGIATAMQRLDVLLADHQLGVEADALAALPDAHDDADVAAIANELNIYYAAVAQWRRNVETELRAGLTAWLAEGDSE